jgi:hypothetical protein
MRRARGGASKSEAQQEQLRLAVLVYSRAMGERAAAGSDFRFVRRWDPGLSDPGERTFRTSAWFSAC